ncbi:MAG: hypothetical protein LBN06_12135 [Prevotellaceae bacterium]|jgi:hypothetical protein|nr:hypothetical protein [Prevotellaceae bacterium]
MNTFRSIDELIKSLDREKELLKEMFAKRKSLSFRYDYALEMTDYKEERIRYLIDYGVIRDTGDFLEMEDIYLRFFEEVLEVNEEINVSSVREHLTRLNENIDYYLKETNEHRKYNYQREVRRILKNIALTTVRNVLDLKRNMDNTYKNEPNYPIKKSKLQRMDEKRLNITRLITECEKLIESGQPVFFRVAMDVQMRNVVSDVKLQLNDASHNLIEIQRQIIDYLNQIAYQNRILEKVKKLKYLKDQFLLREHTTIRQVLNDRNPVWMEASPRYPIKLSIDNLRTADDAFALIRKLAKQHRPGMKGTRQVAEPIAGEFLDVASQPLDVVNLQELYNVFVASNTHLFYFVMNYRYRKEVTRNDKLIFFCQLASQYADELRITDRYETSGEVEYPLIYTS